MPASPAPIDSGVNVRVACRHDTNAIPVASTHDSPYAHVVTATVLSIAAHRTSVITIQPTDCPIQYA